LLQRVCVGSPTPKTQGFQACLGILVLFFTRAFFGDESYLGVKLPVVCVVLPLFAHYYLGCYTIMRRKNEIVPKEKRCIVVKEKASFDEAVKQF
jgi:hypothetical protein